MPPVVGLRTLPVGDGPLVDASSHPSVGENIQGPSLIRAPDWLPNPPGRYLLYFADHKGAHIRLAAADDIEGPWEVQPAGSLQLAESHFLTEAPAATDEELARIEAAYLKKLGPDGLMSDFLSDATTPHIASPDVHVDHRRQKIVMYFHGLAGLARQETRMATSDDAVNFRTARPTLNRTYLRVFVVDEVTYGLAMPGQLYRFAGGVGDGLDADVGPMLFEPSMRHAAVLVDSSQRFFDVFWTRVGDAPERILRSRVMTGPPWTEWIDEDSVEVVRPTALWEGAGRSVSASKRGAAIGFLNQLRDPAVFVEGDRVVLLYAFGGESGIAAVDLIAD